MNEIRNESSVFPNHPQQPLPNATAVLVLGILSIPGCCCWGTGLVLGIIALVLASKDMRRYSTDPAMYTPGSLSNLRTGRICAIIGVSLTAMYVIFYAIIIAMFGIGVLTNPEELRQVLEQYQK